jgi:hypothetical protein
MFFQSYMPPVAIVTVILLIEICYGVLSNIRGGYGTRIWIISTKRRPKLEALVSSRCLCVIGITPTQQRKEGMTNSGDCELITQPDESEVLV